MTWVGPEMIVLNEVSQKEKDKCRVISLTPGTQNMAQKNLSVKQKDLQRTGFVVAKLGGEPGRDGLGALD